MWCQYYSADNFFPFIWYVSKQQALGRQQFGDLHHAVMLHSCGVRA